MSFLNPIAALIAAGITVPLLVALYFLKLKRRPLTVPSTLLWRKAIQDLQVNSPFQRLRKSLLLLLQLLILAALLFALARPTTRTTARPGQKVAILIDHSASMNATPGSGSGGDTRLERAKAKALELIGALDGGEAMVLSFAQSVKMVQQSTADAPLLRDAVRSIQPTDELSNLGPALRLIEPFALAGGDAESADSRMKVYVLSDGNVHQAERDQLSLKAAELTYVKIGTEAPADNVAIISFAARRDADQPHVVRVFARLANYGRESVETTATLSLDGSPARAVQKTIPAGQVSPLQLEFPLPGAALVKLELDARDALATDNTAQLVLAPSRRLSVLLVTDGNWLLHNAVQSAGVRRLVTMTPQRYEQQDPASLARGGWDTTGASGTSGVSGTSGGGEGFDVIVFDAYAPQAVPPVDSLSFGSVPPIEGFVLHPAKQGDPEAQLILDWDRSDPLMRYVVLDDVVIVRPGRLQVPLEGKVLATGVSGPAIASVRRGGQMHVAVSFDILSSFWWKSLSFPVFTSNVMEVLGLDGLSDDAGIMYATGQVAAVPASEWGEVTYRGPVTMTRPVRDGEVVLEPFSRVGLYSTTSDAVSEPWNRLAVNLLDARESDLRVADTLALGTVDVTGQAVAASVRKEVWRWFAWAALGVLMVEWMVYTRRMHL